MNRLTTRAVAWVLFLSTGAYGQQLSIIPQLLIIKANTRKLSVPRGAAGGEIGWSRADCGPFRQDKMTIPRLSLIKE